jgi:hypothetical protein
MRMRKMGRPTKYKKEYCELLIEHGKQGHTLESFAATIGVDRDTLKEWAKTHPEFSAAKKRYKDFQQLTLEKIGLAGMTGKLQRFNSTAWIFMMKNCCGWRDKKEIEVQESLDTGLSKLSDDELNALYEESA